MKKLIGSIIIMLILSQPATTEYASTVKTLSIHIFQEYKDYAKLDIIKKNEDLANSEEDLPTIEDLSDNMDLITNLLRLKQETITTVQNTMNEKVKNKETMNIEQIKKFQEFSQTIQQKNSDLQQILNQINSNKNLNKMQEAILQNNIDYDKLSQEIKLVQDLEQTAIANLTSTISLAHGVLDIL